MDDQRSAAVFETKAPRTEGRSLQSFLASLVTGTLVFVLQFLAFLVLRKKLPELYRPEVHLTRSDSETFQTESLDHETIRRCGLDGYLFVRYLRTLLRIFLLPASLFLPVLLPLNYLSGTSREGPHQADGLDRFSWTNIAPSHARLYWVHLSFSLLLVLWVWRVIWFETHFLIRHRHHRMVTQARSSAGSAILVTDVPADLSSEDKLKETYREYLGGVKKVWIHHDYARLDDLIAERDRVALQLEQAETHLIRQALSAYRRRGKLVEQAPEQWRCYLTPDEREYCRLPIWKCKCEWMPSPPLGRRVDLIDHCRKALQQVNQKLDRMRESSSEGRAGSAIVLFTHARAAHLASQIVHHPQAHLMQGSYIDPAATKFIWSNVGLSWKQQYFRGVVGWMLMVGLCACCIVPTAFTGLLSQLSYLAQLCNWLRWIQKIPSWIQGLLQGVLPAVVVALVSLSLPRLLDWLIVKRGVRTDTAVETSLQDYFFGFLFLQIFLVVSVSASVAAILSGLQRDVGSLARSLASGLPRASNYFLSYILLQGLSVSAGALLQPARLGRFVFSRLQKRTPREIWQSQKQPDIRWGTFYPIYTNLAVIGLIYSVITPLILVVVIVAFALFYAVQRHIIARIDHVTSDTGGLVYFKATNHLFTGLYCMEAYMAILFFLMRRDDGVACAGQGTIMTMMMIATYFFQRLMRTAHQPLLEHLPVLLYPTTPESSNQQTAGPVPSPARWDFLEIWSTWTGRFGQIVLSDVTESGSDTESLLDALTSSRQPVVWLPNDRLGISQDEVRHMRYRNIRASNRNAWVTQEGRIKCSDGPPEFDDQEAAKAASEEMGGARRSITWAV